MRPWAARSAAALAVLVLSAPVAAAFGALHDQVTYSLSPEYYTHLKFDQFEVAGLLQGRLGAALVGVYATWWVGPPIGLVLAPLTAWRQPSVERPLRHALGLAVGAFAVVMGVTAAASGAGFVFGLASEPWLLDNYSPPTGVTDPAAFLRVGAMHTAAYGGGAVGLAVAAVAQVVAARRERRSKLELART